MKRKQIYRMLFYAAGLLLLAMGLTFNAKVQLGVSCVMSVPYALSEIFGIRYAVMTFAVYTVLIALQFLLRGKKSHWTMLLQLPFTFAFSLLMDLFDRLFVFDGLSIVWRYGILIAAIILTATGAAMMVNTKLIPNPVDGIAAATGEALHRDMGFGKNLTDCIGVVITCAIGLIFAGKIVGVGIGTVLSMIFVGRCVAWFNKLFKDKMQQLCLDMPASK